MFQITVDLKSLHIKIAITNFALIVTKYQFKMVFQKFKILQNIFLDKILSEPFTLQFTAGIKLLKTPSSLKILWLADRFKRSLFT